MAHLAAVLPAPAGAPLLQFLVAGFVLLAIGLATLTVRRRGPRPIASSRCTRRAVYYALVYGCCAACFARLFAPALLSREHSPWLLALGDVMFVTLGLFAWVMSLAETHPLRAYGFRGGPRGRFGLAMALGLAAATFYAQPHFVAVLSGQVRVTADSLVFALLFAAAGSALPEEMLFRGYLMASLEGRHGRWACVVMPALAFTAVRAFRFMPGADLSTQEWLRYVFGMALPLGLWWGLMRDLSGGSLWPGLVSHFVLEFGNSLAHSSSHI